MKLILEAVVVDLDDAGNIKSRLYDFSGLVLRLTGTEIDGVKFKLNDNGPSIKLIMDAGEGKSLSEEINTNFPAPANSPVKQITYKIPEARFTANTLNKLMRRVYKDFPDKALLIRNVVSLLYD